MDFQIIIPAICHALLPQVSQKGYALLKVIRKYIELDTYLSLEVQTDVTLQNIVDTLYQFANSLEVRMSLNLRI